MDIEDIERLKQKYTKNCKTSLELSVETHILSEQRQETYDQLRVIERRLGNIEQDLDNIDAKLHGIIEGTSRFREEQASQVDRLEAAIKKLQFNNELSRKKRDATLLMRMFVQYAFIFTYSKKTRTRAWIIDEVSMQLSRVDDGMETEDAVIQYVKAHSKNSHMLMLIPMLKFQKKYRVTIFSKPFIHYSVLEQVNFINTIKNDPEYWHVFSVEEQASLTSMTNILAEMEIVRRYI